MSYSPPDSGMIFIFLFSSRTTTNINYRTTTYNYCNSVDDNIYYRYEHNHQAISKTKYFATILSLSDFSNYIVIK